MKYRYALDVNVYRTTDSRYVEYWHEKTNTWRYSQAYWTNPNFAGKNNFAGPLWADSIEELLELWSYDSTAVRSILNLV